jgi:hypothetical protein
MVGYSDYAKSNEQLILPANFEELVERKTEIYSKQIKLDSDSILLHLNWKRHLATWRIDQNDDIVR